MNVIQCILLPSVCTLLRVSILSCVPMSVIQCTMYSPVYQCILYGV